MRLRSAWGQSPLLFPTGHGASLGTSRAARSASPYLSAVFSALSLSSSFLAALPHSPAIPQPFWVLVSRGSFKPIAKMESLNQPRLLAVEGHGKCYVFCENGS